MTCIRHYGFFAFFSPDLGGSAATGTGQFGAHPRAQQFGAPMRPHLDWRPRRPPPRPPSGKSGPKSPSPANDDVGRETAIGRGGQDF